MKKNSKRLLCMLFAAMSTLSVSMTSLAATSSGKYPTRQGAILVTSDAYKGLIPTGHAAIVFSKTSVVESLSDGVTIGKNNWKQTKNKFYGVSVTKTSAKDDRKAARWCYKQKGKSYNYNFLNVKTRKKFYCSQLIYAAFLDNFNIDLNTSLFGAAIHPMEIVDSPQTIVSYTYSK